MIGRVRSRSSGDPFGLSDSAVRIVRSLENETETKSNGYAEQIDRGEFDEQRYREEMRGL